MSVIGDAVINTKSLLLDRYLETQMLAAVRGDCGKTLKDADANLDDPITINRERITRGGKKMIPCALERSRKSLDRPLGLFNRLRKSRTVKPARVIPAFSEARILEDSISATAADAKEMGEIKVVDKVKAKLEVKEQSIPPKTDIVNESSPINIMPIVDEEKIESVANDDIAAKDDALHWEIWSSTSSSAFYVPSEENDDACLDDVISRNSFHLSTATMDSSVI